MRSELEATSATRGRSPVLRPWMVVLALGASAAAWYVFRPERANPFPQVTPRGVEAAPPASTSFEYYDGALDAEGATPWIDPRAPSAKHATTNTPPPKSSKPPRDARVPQLPKRHDAAPDPGVPRDFAVLPPPAEGRGGFTSGRHHEHHGEHPHGAPLRGGSHHEHRTPHERRTPHEHEARAPRPHPEAVDAIPAFEALPLEALQNAP